ncbi:MAG: anthranilate phosphoribosyltransferase [Oscillospiraceae bacterium]|nr:anthranilate phosphoribosyltransferase [Oscillospiraceae bacterium]
MIKEAIIKAARKENLSYDEAKEVMNEIMSGQASQIQMAAYLTSMAVKGETIDEITGSAAGMRSHCVRLLHNMDVLEIVGTGGDNSNSFNISTTSAIVTSAAGIPVAKHGNRAASSKCGAADVLEALGVNIIATPDKSLKMLEEINICFLFAQNYHIAMKYVAPVRKELGIRTIFNILGPLVNPAGANKELLGVYEEDMVEPMAKVLANLGVQHALVVYGRDGLDEISMSAETSVCEVRDGFLKPYVITPEQFGLKRCDKSDLIGGNPQENAAITREILSGGGGAKKDAVILNSAAAIHVAKPEVSLQEGVDIARDIIDSGKALEQLEKFIKHSGASHDNS